MAYIVSILESFLGECRKNNEDSGQSAFDCPACSYEKGTPEGDGKGNLEVNYQRDVFKCWVCKDTNYMSGSIIKLIKKYGNPKHLRDYKLFKPEAFLSAEDKVQLEVKLPEGFKYLKNGNSKDFKYNLAIKYLRDRGITDKIIEKFDIGYTTKGQFFNRIIIPSYDENDALNYFIARWFDKTYTKLKYLNPDVEKQTIIFNEGKINWDATIYIVEGVTDHIVVPNSIPLLGKYIPDILLDKIYEQANANVVIFLDGDAVSDAEILYDKLNFGRLTDRIRICTVTENYDPSKIYEKWGARGIARVLKTAKKMKSY
jgi:hypothetical protein